jgi:hypothetical protein
MDRDGFTAAARACGPVPAAPLLARPVARTHRLPPELGAVATALLRAALAT